MRSKANFKSHPLHPMLIPFPIAFLVGGFVADVAAWALASPQLAVVGGYLIVAGIVMALLAAVPGFIDYRYTVPPESSGKRRATRHMAANLGAVAAFALVAVLRGGLTAAIGPGLLAVEAAGVALLAAGGWMGGTLVYRNQIGVDHRYAGAGKWKEERVGGGDGDVRVGRSDELDIDRMKLVHIDGRRLVVARTDDGFAAFDDRCSHRGGSLAGGIMLCGTVQCPWHGSQFDVRSGAVHAGPAKEPIATYDVDERDGQLWVRL